MGKGWVRGQYYHNKGTAVGESLHKLSKFSLAFLPSLVMGMSDWTRCLYEEGKPLENGARTTSEHDWPQSNQLVP